MKFYNRSFWGLIFFDRLWQQLQTRWNFTLCRAISAGTKSVSIPNGIEFYGKAVNAGYVNFAFQFPLGIETKTQKKPQKQKQGRIPSRWELKPTKDDPEASVGGQNSIPLGIETMGDSRGEKQATRQNSIPLGIET